MTRPVETENLLDDDLDSALTEVRTAFRMIQRYQRRVLDLVDEVASRLENGLVFRAWFPMHYQSVPPSNRNPAAHWAWDGLPYYDFYALYFRDEFLGNDHQVGDWLIAIRVMADTGFEYADTEPDPPQFASVEESRSQLTVYSFRCVQPMRSNWMGGELGRDRWPISELPVRLAGTMQKYEITIPLAELAGPNQIATFSERVKRDLFAPSVEHER